MDGSHYLAIPFDKSLTVFESVVEIKKAVALSATVEEVLDEEFSEDLVEGGLSIEIKDKDWFMESI